MGHGNEINNKRFYWLKMDRHFFNDARIKKLRSLPKGDTCAIIYQKLLLLSIELCGVLVYEEIEDTFEKEMALKLGEKIGPTETTITFLREQGMLVQVEGRENEFLLIQAQNSIGSESKNNVYKREKREKNAGLENFQPSSNQIPIEKEIDIDTELDIDTDKESKKEIIKKTSSGARVREGAGEGHLSHADIMDEYSVDGEYRDVMENFLRACYLRGHIVTNDELRDILERLYAHYGDDDNPKILTIRGAISGGYNDILELRKATGIERTAFNRRH